MKKIIVLLISLCVCVGCVNRTESVGFSSKVSAVLEVPEIVAGEAVGGADVALRSYSGDVAEAKPEESETTEDNALGKAIEATISEAVFYIFDERGDFVAKNAFAGTESYNLDFPQKGNYSVYVLCNISALIDLPEAPSRNELESLTLPHRDSYDYLPFAGKTHTAVSNETSDIKIALTRINSAILIENRNTDRVELVNATVTGLPSRGNIFDTGTEAVGVTYTESAEAEIWADGNAIVYSFLVPEEQMSEVKIEAEARVRNGVDTESDKTCSAGDNTLTAIAPLTFISRLDAGKQASAIVGYANNDLKIGDPDNWGNVGVYELGGGVTLNVIGGEFFNYNNIKALRTYSGGGDFAFTLTSTEGPASLNIVGTVDWLTIGDGVITVAPNDGGGRECRVAITVGGNNVGVFYIVQCKGIEFAGVGDVTVEDGRVVIVGGRSGSAGVTFDMSSEELDEMEIVPVGNGENGITVTVNRKAKSITALFAEKVDASEIGDEGVSVPVEFRDAKGGVHAVLTFVQRPAVITFDPERYRSLSSQGGEVTASVTVEGDAHWTVNSITDKSGGSVSSWVTKLSPSLSASSGGSFSLEVKPNDGNYSRTAYVRVESRNTISKPYSIMQMSSCGIKNMSSEGSWDAATTTLKAYSKGGGYKFTFEVEKALPADAELSVDCSGANGFSASEITNVSGNVYGFTLTAPDSDNADKEVAHEIVITLNDGEMGRFVVLQAFKPSFVGFTEALYGGVKVRPELKKVTYRASEWDVEDFSSDNAKLPVVKRSTSEIEVAYAETLAYDSEEQSATVTMNLKGGNTVTYKTVQRPVVFSFSDSDLARLIGVGNEGGDVSITVTTKAGDVGAQWHVASTSDSWLTTTPAVGGPETNASGGTLTVKFAANTGEDRTGNIVVESLNTTRPLNVKQRDHLATVTIGGLQWMQYNLANPRQASGGATLATVLPSETKGIREASHGKFYQWNRSVTWNTMGNISGWDTSYPSGSYWETVNDPCPSGFAVPTKVQWKTLINTCNTIYMSDTWSATNYGYLTLTDGSNKLEFPAVGYLSYMDGLLSNAGTLGRYWASDQYDANNASRMYFNNNSIYTNDDDKRRGFNVRCVRQSDNLETVTIGGSQWMKYNVDAPGTVATSLPSELTGIREASHGKFYQWNRNKAWITTGSSVSGWDTSTPSGGSWETGNNPCPSGFVVPTKMQYDALIAACDKTYHGGWSSSDYGYLVLTSGSNKLEFPAVGYRGKDSAGTLGDVGTYGAYWSSTQYDSSLAYTMFFPINSVSTSKISRIDGRSVRCVRQ
ncbi:MAG: hypothetical protein K2L01_08255 [Rikenellaceae bacterium]|nr:hypothetical protein [Rikenellaceae bacterium]